LGVDGWPCSGPPFGEATVAGRCATDVVESGGIKSASGRAEMALVWIWQARSAVEEENGGATKKCACDSSTKHSMPRPRSFW